MGKSFVDKENLELFQGYINGAMNKINSGIDKKIDKKLTDFIEDNVSDAEILDARGGERTLGIRLNKQDKKISVINAELVDKAEQHELIAEKQRINNLINELIVEKERIDNLIDSGNVVDDAETSDIRIAYDGSVYSSAGDSVRQQVGDIYNNIPGGLIKGYKSNYSHHSIFESGSINELGNLIEGNQYIRTKNFINSNTTLINVDDRINFKLIIIRYNLEDEFVDRVVGVYEFSDFDFSKYKYKVVLWGQKYDIDTNYYTKINILSEKIDISRLIKNGISNKTILPKHTTFVRESKNLLIGEYIENHYVNWSDGELVFNNGYSSTKFIKINSGDRVVINHHNPIAFYDEDYRYIGGINGPATDSVNYTLVPGEIEGQNLKGIYTIPSGVAYIRVTIANGNDTQLEYGEECTDYVEPGLFIDNLIIPKKEIITSEYTFKKIGDVCYINTPKAYYEFRKVTDKSINIDTWRLYTGQLKNSDMKYTMWRNSDAEGAILIQDESDFVCGFHGDEIMTDIKIIIDGEFIDLKNNINRNFNNIDIIVKSKVYHCNTSSLANTQVFERVKSINFNKDSVEVSNKFKCLTDVMIKKLALNLFQCYKTEDNTQILYGLWDNESLEYKECPENTETDNDSVISSPYIKNVKFFVKNGVINFEALDGFYDEYNGYVANFSSQNRLKIYLSNEFSSGKLFAKNSIIRSRFRFSIE